MTTTRRLGRVAFGVLCLAAASAASADVLDGADPVGRYVGVDMGVAHFPDDARIDLGAVTLATADANDDDNVGDRDTTGRANILTLMLGTAFRF